ncbi:hypothetical protein VPH35_025207 [Triticum aestivum]
MQMVRFFFSAKGMELEPWRIPACWKNKWSDSSSQQRDAARTACLKPVRHLCPRNAIPLIFTEGSDVPRYHHHRRPSVDHPGDSLKIERRGAPFTTIRAIEQLKMLFK